MTATTTSPKELLAAYRAQARASAANAGRPGNRSRFPGLHLDPTGMIYLRSKRLVYHAKDEGPVTLDPDRLATLLTEDGASTVVADQATFAKMLVMADNLPSTDFKSLGRRLRISRGLPLSLKLPLLTDALACRYWLPEGLSESNLDHWADAFGAHGLQPSQTMRNLIRHARDGLSMPQLGYERTVKELAGTEGRIMEKSVFSGLSTDCYVFSMLEGFTAVASGLRTIDPGLLDMHVIDGQACRITPMNVTFNNFTASVSQPFKLKEGARLRMTDGFQMVDVTLEALRFGEGSLHAVFTAPTSRGKAPGPSMIESAKKGLAPLYVTEAPYAGRGSGLANQRWLKEPVERITGRDVPLDVVIAGAPVEQSAVA